ncbi:MAG: hypothetical protein IJF18_06520 [Oscillospiraceae bacterium]|nr:hypothetical protein [Oscillospiraceae bacterium]
MSKSIKQYKDAMDNIRISESFLKRTENLLKELPENETVTVSSKKPQNLRHIILAAGLGAAACITAAVTLSPAMVKDEIAATDIVTEVTSVTEVTAPNETVYIDIERDDQIIIPAADAELLEKDPPDETAAETNADVTVTESVVVTEKAVTESVVVTESAVTESVKPVAEEVKTDSDTAPAQETAEEESVEAEPQLRYLYDIDFSNAEVELVAYINSASGTLTPGDAPAVDDDEDDDEAVDEGVSSPSEKKMEMVILDTEAAEKLVTAAADIIYSSEEIVPDGRYSPALFAVSINNITTGNKAFEIYLNENGTVTLTVFTNTISFFEVYKPTEEKFALLERAMFLYFGNAEEYESYLAAKSGE